MKKVYTTWVPKLLTPLGHVNRVDCCEELLENCNQDSTGFFGRVVTEDETRMHHYDPLKHQEAKTWKKPDEKTPARSRVIRSARKIIMIIFWDRKDVLFVNFRPHGNTINGPYYASLLHRLRSSVGEKHRGKLGRAVLLLRDNTPVHRSNITQTSPN